MENLTSLAFLFATEVEDHGKILVALFIALLAAKLMAELFERIRQPAVVGEVLAGVLIGPALLNWVQPSPSLETLAEIGVIFLLFTVGLETRPSDIFKVGGTAVLTAVLGVIVPFAAGWGLLSLWPGYSWVEAVFLGAAMVATSVGITARVLSGMGLINADASRVILAAAVIDDVLGLLVLAIVSSVAEGQVNYLRIALTAIFAVGFTALTVTLGARIVNRVKRPLTGLKISHSLLVFALVLCFGLAAVAHSIGIAGIIGAFLAGVALSEATDGTSLHQQSEGLTEFLTPFFLVTIGMKLDLTIFLSANVVWLALVVVALAIISKLVGCGLGALRMGRRRATQVGLGMMPRGEVGIIVAQIGLSLTANHTLYGLVVAMAVITTLVAPPLIRVAFKGETAVPPDSDYADELRRELHYPRLRSHDGFA
ncbi:MAG TPA: cation:proton antiporter [Blastocatellia bacterium]|nr:cation:proton antiporter [Blastocatellia bacterium]